MKKPYDFVLIFMVLILSGCSTADATQTQTQPPEVETAPTDPPVVQPTPTSTPTLQLTDVPYTPAEIAFQKLDVYLPENGEGPFPTILAIHGGGFRMGTKSIYYHIAHNLNETGYAVVSTNYRLTPKFSYPAQVEDVFCALAWIYENQESYPFDPEKIFVMGDSVGGYLAAMIATVDDPVSFLNDCPYSLPAQNWVRGAVIYYGVFDLVDVSDHNQRDVLGYVESFLGAKHAEMSAETLADMSPFHLVDGNEPPFLLIHGIKDLMVPSSLSEEFAAVLEEAGVEAELLMLDESHGFIMQQVTSPGNTQSLEAIKNFLSNQIQN